MENKTKLRTVREDQWERKEYIATCDSSLVKDTVRIRLHLQELKKNYPRKEEDMKCPICNQKKDTREHVLECQTAKTVYRIREIPQNAQKQQSYTYKTIKLIIKKENKKKHKLEKELVRMQKKFNNKNRRSK